MMIYGWMHPTERALTRFATGDVEEARRAPLARHLAQCAPCRARVAFLRQLKGALSGLQGPPASAELLARIHDRLSHDEHVILPVSDAGPAPARWRSRAAAAALVAAGAALWFLWPAAPLTAADSQGELTFTPATPHAGESVQVMYRAPTTLAGRDRLVLRARYRTPRDGSYNSDMRQAVAAELTPTRDGSFRGSLRLPDSVVYGAFAVEDADGRHVDSNGSRLWELLLHDSSGRPTFDALSQREHDLMGRNWELGYETARQVAALYPERISSWYTLLFYERYALGESHTDSALAGHRARLHALHERLSARASLSPDDVGDMFWYASMLPDSALAAYWAKRLEREAPRSPFAAQNRAADIWFRLWRNKDSLRALADMDRLWDDVGPAHGNVVNLGWRVAQVADDSAGLVRWASRYLSMNRGDSLGIATDFTHYPALRSEGMRLLRQQLRGLETPNSARRALERTVDEQRVVDAARARQILVALGDALVASGQRAAGLDTLKLAVREGWDVFLYRRVAQIQLSTGDTAGALRLLGLVAADPATTAWGADSARRFTGAPVDSAAWARLVREGRGEMRRRLLDLATRRRLPEDVRLQAAAGGTVRLDTLTRGRVTFVAFWSRYCGPSKDELPAVERVAARLRQQGVAVVTITDERVSDDLRRFLAEQKLTFPVYGDAWREASRGFSQWGTPAYFVLDGDGLVRFQYQNLNRILSEVAALQ
jgi:peroxiredoxin